MEPFETLGVPSPDECPGSLGLLVSLAGAAVGVVWLVLVAANALLGWVSVVYCGVWEQSLPIPD